MAVKSVRPIRLGMVGGGQGAFIGGVHRIAARLDGHFELVAGAYSSYPKRAHASAAELGIERDRSYESFAEMAKREADREDGIEAVSIVTPNHLHFPAAKAFLEAGIHVICDKPLTANLKDAQKLVKLVEKSGKLFVLTHNYTGYPMIRQAQEMVAKGKLGDIRLVNVEYLQDWLAEPIELTGQKQAEWRTDPARSGSGGCVGDIGTHAFNLALFVTGLEVDKMRAQLDTFVEGRKLDDNVQAGFKFKPKGNAPAAQGALWASQVAPGNENNLTLRVYGAKGAIEWAQENPNMLWFTPLGKPKQLLTRGGSGAGAAAANVTRIPAGHPEGYLEGFSTLYTETAAAIRQWNKSGSLGKKSQPPTVGHGLTGMKFIDSCVKSSQKGGAWLKVSL